MPLGTLDRTPPPFFKQGPSALSKLVVFSAVALFLMVADLRFRMTAPLRTAVATVLYPVQWAVMQPIGLAGAAGGYFASLHRAQQSELDALRRLCQVLALPDEVALRLATGLLHQPVSVDVAPRNTAAETVTQRVIETNREQKKDLLLHLFETRSLNQVLIFTRTKHGADALSRHLEKAGIKSAALHGNKSQNARQLALKNFKDKTTRVLVATDIAARGIDVDDLTHVINFEMPEDDRLALMNGWDQTDIILNTHGEQIDSFENDYSLRRPWLAQHAIG